MNFSDTIHRRMKCINNTLEKLKQNGPVVKVHIECYHSSTSTSIRSGGSNLLTKYVTYILLRLFLCVFRNEKIITYTDQQEVPLTGWSDVTEWPTLTDLASQVNLSSNVARIYFLFRATI